MKRLFGTDGIRGVAGRPPLDAVTVRQFGVALAETLLEAQRHEPVVVIGRDTRESGPWLRDAVASGLAMRGGTAVDVGVVTTPALAHAVGSGGFDAGVMISASHNPFHDNGLKVFASNGMKLADDLESRVESRILDPANVGREAPEQAADLPVDSAMIDRYVEHVADLVSATARSNGARILVDCSNGSAVSSAPVLFRRVGIDVDLMAAEPDGRNINLNCGSTHLEALCDRMRDGGYLVGLAFDGDADRCLAVDRKGRVVDGDHILYLGARHLQRQGHLRRSRVVATIMSNFWLERRLSSEGIELVRTPVGDKYVLERMIRDDAAIGGEQSGHVIFRDYATTGDGLLTAVMLLNALGEEDHPLESFLDEIVPAPQVLLNIPVSSKPDLHEHPTIGPAVKETEQRLEGSGRVVLRYSGTEPLARVMVEGEDETLVRESARDLAGLIERTIGG